MNLVTDAFCTPALDPISVAKVIAAKILPRIPKQLCCAKRAGTNTAARVDKMKGDCVARWIR